MSITTQEKLSNYTNAPTAPTDDREIDARALLSCASGLRDAIDAQGQDKLAYGNAIRRNQRLWTMFQVALCEPDNQLPQSLKNTLLSLSHYVDRVSFRALGEFSPQLLNSLIDINRTIATGLRAKQPETAVPKNTAAAAPMEPPSAGSVTISA